jgi:uncharacterized membrane protein
MDWPDLSCSLNPTWPPWLPDAAALPALLAVAALLVVITVWTYLGTRARPGRVAAVLLLRLVALVVALLVALRPSLAVQMLEGLEPSKLLIVADASESMSTPDDFNGSSRWDNARRILSSPRVVAALKRLSAEEQIELVYYQAAEGLAPFDPNGSADGKRTDIGAWLHELHQKHAGQDRLRGVILFSDGADNGTRFPTLEEARRWKGVCPLYTFGHGNPQPDAERKDIIVANVDAMPSPVPAKTKLTVTGTVHAPGFKGALVKVELWAQSSKDAEPSLLGDVETHQLTDDKNNKIVLTRDAPETPDEYKLTLKIEKVDGEADDTNNEASTFLQVTKEGVSVLWVEGRKRPYEPIFAQRALAADKRFRVYAAEVGVSGPREPERFGFDKRHYDVIVIGDLGATQFAGPEPPAVYDLIRDLVEKKNVGLMMLGGIDTFGKGGWNKTALAELLPVQLDTAKQVDSPVRVLPDVNALAARFPFLHLDDDAKKNDTLWQKQFGKLDGMAALGAVKPGATLLAKAKEDGEPILVAGKRGGRVLVFGGDTTWKAWGRKPETIDAYRKFWRQAILWLANQDDRTGNLWVELNTRRLLAGTSERLDFKFGLKGKTGKEVAGAQYQVFAEGPGNQKVNIRPEPGKDEQHGILPVPAAAGEYLLKLSGKGKDSDGSEVADEKAVRFLVVAENLELLRKAPDHEHLIAISQASGGRFDRAGDAELLKLLNELKGQVRRESHAKVIRWPDWDRHPASPTWSDQFAGLWGSTAALWFLAFAGCLAAEWGLRRRWGMV